jgi:hypothetical protein
VEKPRSNGTDPQTLAMQLKRSQAAMQTLAVQREEQANKAAEARIEALMLSDELTAARQRIDAMQKEIETLRSLPSELPAQRSLPLVDGARAPHIN